MGRGWLEGGMRPTMPGSGLDVMGSFVFLSKERTNSSPSALGEPVGPGPGLGPRPDPLVASAPHPHLSSATPGPSCLQSALVPTAGWARLQDM